MPKPPLPQSRDERARAYLNVLFEINARLNYIPTLEKSDLPLGLAREVCQLQFRHICELITIGCLVIQGDYRRPFHDEYNPQNVFKGLSRLYKGFFPLSAEFQIENGVLVAVEGRQKHNAMTRSDIEQLWSNSGKYLHRLKIHNFFRPEHWAVDNFWPETNVTIERIKFLLNPHVIAMNDPKILVVAGLDGDHGKKPNLMFVNSRPDGKVDLTHFHGRGETPYWRGV